MNDRHAIHSMKGQSASFSTLLKMCKLPMHTSKGELSRLSKKHDAKAQIIAKLEYFNPGGSVKDRIALAMIEDAEAKGILKPGAVIIEPTSGNTGVGLAWVASVKGYKAILTMPETMSEERQNLLKAMGAQLVLTEGAKGMKGAIEKAEELRDRTPGAVILGQFENPANPAAHARTTAQEIWNDTDGKVDIFVAGVGTGGTLSGVAEGLKKQNPHIQIVAVEPDNSPVLSGGNPGLHKIQGIGAGFIPHTYNEKLVDKIIRVKDDDAIRTGRELSLELCTATARKYGLSLNIIDLHRQYWDNVVAYAIDKVKRGLTPNPDVMCNKLIKFGCFEQEAGHLYDKTATGHYASILEKDGKIWLGTAQDPVKDQTDFLAQIDYLQISKLMFPLGGLMKNEVRDIARIAKLPSAQRKDSQGICFLGKINYNEFLRRFLGEKEGDIIEMETGKRIGTHKGYWFHTIGQRKGLGLGGGPWFVIRKDIDENIIYVSHGYDTDKQYGTDFALHDFHFITEDLWKGAPSADVSFKIRHTDTFMKGILTREDNLFRIHSHVPLQGIAPGQFGVLYDKNAEICVGSGEITLS